MMHQDDLGEQGWDLDERDALLEDGTLLDLEAPDPTVVLVAEDE